MNAISISQLRTDTAKYISDLASSQQVAVIMQRSKPKAVLVDYDYFQALEEAVLDTTDAQEAERAKKDTRVPLKSYLKKRFGLSSI